jgi:4-amino-4-deoxy-L-arabinose transferase-like glycosyltransferase
MDIQAANSKSNYSRIFLVSGVLLLSAAASLPMLSVKTLSNHECYVSVTTREMLQSGNWVVPTCNGEPRLQKTPLSYWLVAGFSKITGRVDELATRLPSAISGILSAAAILYFVRRWLSLRAAAISAAVWVTMLSYIRYSRNGRPEMLMTLFVVVSFLSFYSAITEENRKRQVACSLVFWVSFALGNLAKGPAPIAYVGVPLFFYVLVFKQWKKVPRLLPIAGPLIFLAIVSPWPLAIASKFNWHMDIWKREFFDRFFGEYDAGHKPTYFYFYVMFLFAIPWVVFLPMALAAPFFKVWRAKSGPMWFCWMWFAADFAFITIDGGKRQHYILPLMPATAILIGILIEDMAFVHSAYSLKQAKGIVRNHIVVIVAGVIGASVYAAKVYSGFFGGVMVVAGTAIAAAAVIAVLFAKGRTASGLATVFASVIVLAMVTYGAFTDSFDSERHSRDFSRRLAEIVPPSGELVGYRLVSKRTVQYFGRVVPVIENKSQLYDDYEQGSWVLATGKRLKELADDGRFRMVYYSEKAELDQQNDISGALFHKSAPVVKDEGGSSLQAASTFPSQR